MLCNVNVLGQATPTARFMSGREFAALLDGAPPDLGALDDVQQLLHSHTVALPSFAPHGGPFTHRAGQVLRAGEAIALQALPPGQRSALAALCCAQITAWLVLQLRPASAAAKVVVEGPLAHNALYLGLLQALLPGHQCQASTDAMEVTARGTWMLSRWPVPTTAHSLQAAPRYELNALDELQGYHAAWLNALH